MNLPPENATTEELTAFVVSLSTARRARLAVALIAPELIAAALAADGGEDDPAEITADLVDGMANAANEFGVRDLTFSDTMDSVYSSI